MKYFYSSLLVSVFGLILGWFIAGWLGVYICALLGILEVSLSFDNAVVNAKVLGGMSEQWRRRFIIWGIPIAVFGMRFLFPIIIVAVVAGLGILQTAQLAINDPASYHEALASNKELIYIFGGAFLLMVFLRFFFEDKEVFWLKIVEDNILVRHLAKSAATPLMIAILGGLILVGFTHNYSFALAYFGAILLHTALHMFDEILSGDSANSVATKSGLAGFLYLEVLDASFSFDGVIGAFAMSENIFIIMIGLGIGAMFVRSLTLFMVEKKTLQSFIFLEHGAHYAILALAIIMFIDLFYEVGEIITGLISFGLIMAATAHSVLVNKQG